MNSKNPTRHAFKVALGQEPGEAVEMGQLLVDLSIEVSEYVATITESEGVPPALHNVVNLDKSLGIALFRQLSGRFPGSHHHRPAALLKGFFHRGKQSCAGVLGRLDQTRGDLAAEKFKCPGQGPYFCLFRRGEGQVLILHFGNRALN